MAISRYTSQLLFANNATSTLAGAITNVQTTAQLAAGSGALFPVPAAGQAFVLTLQSATNPAAIEIVLVTGIAGDTITLMVRGQEGTTAQAFNSGDFASMDPTAGTMTSIQQFIQAQPARTSPTTSGAFTLTNNDGAVGLKLTGAANSTMPPAPSNGQVVTIADLLGNFNQFNVTLAPNAGQAFAVHDQNGNAVLSAAGQVASFQWFSDSNTWSVKP